MARAAAKATLATSANGALTSTVRPAAAFTRESSLSGRKRLNRCSHSANSARTRGPVAGAESGARTRSSVPIASYRQRRSPGGVIGSGATGLQVRHSAASAEGWRVGATRRREEWVGRRHGRRGRAGGRRRGRARPGRSSRRGGRRTRRADGCDSRADIRSDSMRRHERAENARDRHRHGDRDSLKHPDRRARIWPRPGAHRCCPDPGTTGRRPGVAPGGNRTPDGSSDAPRGGRDLAHDRHSTGRLFDGSENSAAICNIAREDRADRRLRRAPPARPLRSGWRPRQGSNLRPSA